MGALAARKGDNHVKPKLGGPIQVGAGSVWIEGSEAARQGDLAACGNGTDVISQGDESVIIEGMPAARVGDKHDCGGAIANGASRTFIGLSQLEECLLDAAEQGALLVVPGGD